MGLATDLSGIRLSDRERAALGKAMGIHTGNDQRRHRRFLLPKEFALVVRLQQPGGKGTLITVTPRDMSSSGIGFFHAAYVHPGTSCSLLMRTLEGNGVSVPATVVRCRHVSGRIHEVGALFESELDVEAYIDDARQPETAPSPTHCVTDTHARMTELAADLKHLVEIHAAPAELLSRIGEFALLLTGDEAKTIAAPSVVLPPSVESTRNGDSGSALPQDPAGSH